MSFLPGDKEAKAKEAEGQRNIAYRFLRGIFQRE